MADEKIFYVGISNKSEVRRELLECSKNVVGILKQYDHLSSIREEKIEKIIDLKSILAEIRQLNGLLKETLPVETLKNKTKNVKKNARIVKTKTIKLIPKPNYKKPSNNNEIKKLEEELGEIESRLSKMGI